MEIKTPEHLVAMVQQLTISEPEKKKLNRALANHTRRYFRKQITSQKDIYGKAYAPRKKPKIEFGSAGKAKLKTQMLVGLSRMLITQADANGFSVGLTGVAGKVAKIHNQGNAFSFTTRMNGFFNAKSNRWEGGSKEERMATMPKRTIVGWTKKLEIQIADIILQKMTPA